MSEAAFPLLGPLIVVGLVLPLSALVAKAALLVLDRLDPSAGLHGFQAARYGILVGSSAVPLAWFVSAALHQAEHGLIQLVCLNVHAPDALCAEAAHFSLVLTVLAVAFTLPRLWREQFLPRASASAAANAVRLRIESLIGADPALTPLRGRVVVSDALTFPVATIGLLFRRVIVKTSFVAALDDGALSGTLHHELEHFQRSDPLRYFLASWALAANPLGSWLLRGHHARWMFSREAHCDRQAVLSGASPTALAEALVSAARPRKPALSPALGAGPIETLKLRLGLLLAYADRRPEPRSHGPALRIVLAIVLLCFALPHGAGTEPLDAVHELSERAAAFLFRS